MEWKEVRLGDVCEIKHGFAYKGKYFSDTPTCDILVTPGNFTLSGGFKLDKPKFYNGPVEKDYILSKGDLIVTMTDLSKNIDTLGYSALVPEVKGLTFHHNQRIGLVENIANNVDKYFLYWIMRTPAYQSFIATHSSGTTVHHTSPKGIGNYVFKLPPLDDQRRIASILSSLDRKIELNNKINADLEEMAQAIFKNWFVDFEPFKNGKFVDSELGMIPEGWKVGRLGELCNFKRGKNLLTKNAIDEGVPVVAGGLEPSCYHNVANTGAPVITVSGSGANAGFMRMYHVPVWASDCSFIDISCENFYFVYCFLKVNSKLLKHAQTGAVQPHVKPSDIHDFELVIPDKESIYDFQDKVKPFFDRIASLQKESSRLSLLRLSLLPRLMSGELEVPE